jgi:lauroyl/myristoyl acyltransferase
MICGLFDCVGYRFGVRKDVARKQMQKVYPDWSDEQLNRTLREMYRLMLLMFARPI